MSKYTVDYKPDPVSTYTLARFDDELAAIRAAMDYSQTYYGECSAITVRQGRRIIHNIPRGAGREIEP